MSDSRGREIQSIDHDEDRSNGADEDGWEYHELMSRSVMTENVENVELKDPRVAISKYVPLIEFDADEKAIHFTTKYR